MVVYKYLDYKPVNNKNKIYIDFGQKGSLYSITWMRTGDSFNVSLIMVSKFSIGIKCGSCPQVVTITLEQCLNIFGTFHKRIPVKIKIFD